jgi:hypothetical protein
LGKCKRYWINIVGWNNARRATVGDPAASSGETFKGVADVLFADALFALPVAQ